MKAIPLAAIQVISFIVAAATIVSMNVVFWVSFAVFAGTCVYIQKHKRRLMDEIDRRFGKDEIFE